MMRGLAGADSGVSAVVALKQDRPMDCEDRTGSQVDSEVIIIGAGLGGLTSAILLGMMGMKTILVERNAQPGGLLRSYTRQGVDCPVGVHYFGPAGEGELLRQLFDVLGVTKPLALNKLGGEGILEKYIFDDCIFELPSTLEGFGAALSRSCPGEQSAIDTIVTSLASMSQGLYLDRRGILAASPFSFGGIDQSMAEFMASAGCSSLLQRILTVHGFWTGLPMDKCPAFLILNTLGVLLRSSWELGCTGQQMADIYAKRVLAAGVELILGDPVEEIRVDEGRARGIRLRSGRTLTCNKLVAGIHPKLVVSMLPTNAVPEPYRRGLMQLKETPGAVCAHVLVPASRVPVCGHNTFRIHETDNVTIDGTFLRVRHSERPGYNLLTLITGSDYHQWSRWHDTLTGKRGEAYLQQKSAIVKRMVGVARDVFGPLGDYSIIDSTSPLSMRDWMASPEGGLYGLMRSVTNDLQYAVMTRLPVRSLYLVGQNAIAPGLLGVSLSVLRCVGDVVGRAHFQKFLAEKLYGNAEC